jgi:hypothetical protein
MTTLHKTGTASHDEVKYTFVHARQRLQPLNPRNYNSSKQLTTNTYDLESTKPLRDRSRFLEHLLPSIEKPEHKNHESHRLKLVNQRERYEVIRKNASLKLLRREEGAKVYNKSRAEEIRNLETLIVTREDKTSI